MRTSDELQKQQYLLPYLHLTVFMERDDIRMILYISREDYALAQNQTINNKLSSNNL